MFKRVKKIKGKVRRWSDYDRISESVSGWKDFVTKFFILQTPEHRESFEEAVARLKLKPADIEKRKKTFKRLTLMMLIISAAIFSYIVYNLFHIYWFASLLSFILFVLSLVLTFRYHFWYCQMQHRILGMTFLQWFRIGLLKQSYKKDSEAKDLEAK